MKVSIIIPIYNVEHYISDCLQSVMKQTFTGELECILVDDRGQDRSIEIAEEMLSAYKGNIHFSILQHEHNKGLSGARNTGMRAATGDYVYFLDSDDEITANCIEMLAQQLQKQDYDMVVGDYKIVGPNTGFFKLEMITGESYLDKDIPPSYCQHKWMQMAWNKLYKLSYLRHENLMFKEGIIYEDELWSLEIAATARCICGVKEETYIYKINENSIMTSKYDRKLDERLRFMMNIHNEYYNFAVNRNILTNKNYFILYEYCATLPLMYAEKISPKQEKQTLKEMRRVSNIHFSTLIRINKFNIRDIIKNAHICLPGMLGWFWYSNAYKPIKKIYLTTKIIFSKCQK